ncbi:MAG: hypothetical protein LBN93_03105, partial [Candidatus Symbiothrix sp.]|jgi:hypothetical protein|nr:hypothetical protein [Candidatus Symbiothrix sp.]
VAIGGDGTVTAGAALDLSKANGGLLLPQVTSNPTSGDLLKKGMMIYNTTAKTTYTYDGAAWVGSEITINGGGVSGGTEAPNNPVLPGFCGDYNQYSWRVGNFCIHPADNIGPWPGSTNTCEVGWQVISISELIDAYNNAKNPTYVVPIDFAPLAYDITSSGSANFFWVRDMFPLWDDTGNIHSKWSLGTSQTDAKVIHPYLAMRFTPYYWNIGNAGDHGTNYGIYSNPFTPVTPGAQYHIRCTRPL